MGNLNGKCARKVVGSGVKGLIGNLVVLVSTAVGVTISPHYAELIAIVGTAFVSAMPIFVARWSSKPRRDRAGDDSAP